MSRSKGVRDYHGSVSFGILWKENQNTMIVEGQINFPTTTQKNQKQNMYIIMYDDMGLALIVPSPLFI